MSESDSSSSTSSSSGSFGSSDDVDPPAATPLWPLEVQINYTQDLEEAKEQRAKYKEKLNKAGHPGHPENFGGTLGFFF